jgi:transcriptional regulator with GAF, ATPase, and Fis domain
MTFHGRSSVKSKGTSFYFKTWTEIINRVANSDKSVLILGETGTGKDFTAKKIHELSDKRDKPFVAINCANIPEELFEAELFGYARGSFTGAIKEKQGLLEIAEDGTIYLDEIGDLSSYLQAKILRVIEEREIRRVGETVQRKILARFIFATNKELYEEVKLGRFRKDLYFRISVVRFYLPPLRERKDEIPFLVNHILERENTKQKAKKEISSRALKKLMSYDFPGNIRELENIIERAYILSGRSRITAIDINLDYELVNSGTSIFLGPEKLKMTLENCHWNKTRAALKVGKSRRHLYRLLEKHKMADCIRKKVKFGQRNEDSVDRERKA